MHDDIPQQSKSEHYIIYVIYDGACPMCRQAVKRIDIQPTSGVLMLVDARREHPIVKQAVAAGLDLNQGLIVVFKDHYYQGSAAASLIARLNTHPSIISRMGKWLFQHPFRSQVVYSIFKWIRQLWLKILRIDDIP